ncbi:MAG: enoyl-CoA hydratase/isomerase family protein [Pseudomonadota bacterium]
MPFAAGGDVRAIAESLSDKTSRLSQDFFREEYVLNRRIHRFPKPYIALLDGVSMGGGFGVSVHGRFASPRRNSPSRCRKPRSGCFPTSAAPGS